MAAVKPSADAPELAAIVTLPSTVDPLLLAAEVARITNRPLVSISAAIPSPYEAAKAELMLVTTSAPVAFVLAPVIEIAVPLIVNVTLPSASTSLPAYVAYVLCTVVQAFCQSVVPTGTHVLLAFL